MNKGVNGDRNRTLVITLLILCAMSETLTHTQKVLSESKCCCVSEVHEASARGRCPVWRSEGDGSEEKEQHENIAIALCG